MSNGQESARLKPVVLTVILTLFLMADLSARTPPMWGGLEPGPYAPGFRTVEEYDYSRTFRSRYDYFGEEQPGKTARPIQICMWYPAEKTAVDQPAMVYGEYAFPYPENIEFVDLLSGLQNREVGALYYTLNSDVSLVQDMMNLEMSAIRDAGAQEGSFPLVIYHPATQSSYCQNAVMCEYLASHGFIVATTHSLGTAEVNPQQAPDDLETVLRDREFVLAYMLDNPNVDGKKIGLLGYGDGGLTALLMQMRNFDVSAVVSLEGLFIARDQLELVRRCAFYRPGRMTVPLLQMYAGGLDVHDLALFDSLLHSERYSIELNGLQPAEFTSYGLISASSPNTSPQDAELARRGYETTCRYVLSFFRGYLGGDEASLEFVKSTPSENGLDPEFVTHRFFAAEEVPPTVDQFLAMIRGDRIDDAAELCKKFNLTNPQQPILTERTLQGLGYQFLQGGNIAAAIQLFTMGTEAFPNSANSWDCLGEAYAANGDNETAIEYYQKALEVLPNDTTTDPQLKELIRTNAPQVIERLKESL